MADELHLTYLNRPDVEALGLTDEEILDAVEGGLRGQGAGRDRDRAARAPAPRRVVPRALQRAARLHRAARAGRRQGRRRLRRQLPARPAVGERAAHALRPAHRRAAGGDRCRRTHRHAHRSGHGARCARARPAGIARARPHRRARHGLLERAPARPPVRARRDPRPLAAAREPRGFRRAPRARPRASRHRLRRLGVRRARRRHRGRGRAARAPEPMLLDRVDQARRAGGALRHDERRRALPDRHHGQARRERLGPVPQRAVRIAARPRRGGPLSEETLHAELGEIVAAQARARERRRDDPLLAPRIEPQRHRARTRACSRRRRASGSASACVTPEDAGTLGARPWVRTNNSAPAPPPEYGFTSSARSPWRSTTVRCRRGAGGCARPRRSSSSSRSPRATACIASR